MHEIDMSNGRANMAYTGEVPWHSLGQAMPADATIEQWRQAAGMEWEAIMTPVLYRAKKGQLKSVSDKRVIYRSDTGTTLSVVSDDYRVVQPGEILEFFRELVDGTAFTIETAGCLRGGRKVWALAKASEGLLEIGGDKIKRYALLATSFDKSLATIFQQTSIRVVCNNTLSMARSAAANGDEKQLKINHLQKVNFDQVKMAAILDQDWETFCSAVGTLAARKVTVIEAKQFFLDTYYPPEFRENSKRFFKRGAERHVNRMLEIFAEAPGQDLSSARETAWGMVNAVTYHVDHEVKSVNQDNRLDKAWFGKGAETKGRAFELAMALSNN